MGGTTITIQKDNLLDAINELIRTNERCEGIPLWLDSITIATKNIDEDEHFFLSPHTHKYYDITGNEGIELSVGIAYPKEKLDKNIIIFAHFGK